MSQWLEELNTIGYVSFVIMAISLSLIKIEDETGILTISKEYQKTMHVCLHGNATVGNV